MNLFSWILYVACHFYFKFAHLLKFALLLTLENFGFKSNFWVLPLDFYYYFVSLGSEGLYMTNIDEGCHKYTLRAMFII